MRARLSKTLGQVVGALALAALSACGSSTQTQPPQAAASVPDPAPSPTAPAVTGPANVAILVPLSAADEQLAAFGRALANAGQLAREELGDAELRLTTYDTGAVPARAAAAAREAVAAEADLIIGPLLSGSVRAVRPIAEGAGIKVIGFSTDSSVAGDPVYLAGFLPEWEAERVLDHASREGLGRVAAFVPNTPLGAAVERGADAAAASGRVQIVAMGRYERSFDGIQAASADFAAAARAAGAGAVLLPAGGQELQAAGSFLNYYDLDPASVQYLGLGQWQAPITLQEPALQGGWFPSPDPERVAEFLRRYEARFAERPPALAALGYDAVWVAGDLLRTARAEGRGAPFTRAAILRPEGFEGAFGALRFTPDGRNQRALAILEVGQRDFVLREPAPSGFGPGS